MPVPDLLVHGLEVAIGLVVLAILLFLVAGLFADPPEPDEDEKDAFQ